MKKLFRSIIVLLICSQGALYAQNGIVSQVSTAKGLGVNIETGYLNWSSSDFMDDAESGFFIGAGASYGISELLEVFAQFSTAPSIKSKVDDLGSYAYTYLDAGVRFNFGSTLKPLRPFADLAFTYVNSNQNLYFTDDYGFSFIDEANLSGGAFSFGAGARYHITLPFAIKAGVRFTTGGSSLEYQDVTFDDTYGHFDYRIYVGASYSFY